MALLAVVPERSNFNLSPSELLALPVRIRDKMLEQLATWRSAEDAQAKKLKSKSRR